MAETAVFEADRSRLLGLAYRITGTWTDAEDVVQDTWLRWTDVDEGSITNASGWLTTVCSRLAIDRRRITQRQREDYVGPWLPEPISTQEGPEGRLELAESLTVGFLVALERLGPVERAVFVLRDVFAVPFPEIATVVDKSEVACRQIASRARSRIRADKPVRAGQAGANVDALLAGCLSAAVAGDVVELERLFSDDVMLVSDGGPRRHAARRPVVGPDRVSRFLTGIAKRGPKDAEVQSVEANGQPAVVVMVDGDPYVLLMAEPDRSGQLIRRIWAIVNPDKLSQFC